MDYEDDEIYPEHESAENGRYEVPMRDVEDGEEEGEEVEDDSDDDINFIVDAKEEPKNEANSQSKAKSSTSQNETETQKSSNVSAPALKRENTPISNINRIGTPQDDGRPGTDFPARHTSTLDPLNGNPVHPGTNKPILDTDFDTDFPTESSKPWRKPGADITDYFNYGFDEFTWASYCLKKQQMPQEVKQINQEAEQMKAFVEGIGGGGMPGMPGMPGSNNTGTSNSMPQMPGMPSEQDMQQMLQVMMAQGMDPSSMDPNQFMQMMMGGGGGGGGQFPQGQQPPSGPAAFQAGGGGGYQENFSGGRGRGRGGRRNW